MSQGREREILMGSMNEREDEKIGWEKREREARRPEFGLEGLSRVQRGRGHGRNRSAAR